MLQLWILRRKATGVWAASPSPRCVSPVPVGCVLSPWGVHCPPHHLLQLQAGVAAPADINQGAWFVSWGGRGDKQCGDDDEPVSSTLLWARSVFVRCKKCQVWCYLDLTICVVAKPGITYSALKKLLQRISVLFSITDYDLVGSWPGTVRAKLEQL